MDNANNPMYEVIVVGGGHAGVEAALAAARMGRRTLMITMNLDTIALMPCNPSIGGPAKGHLTREIDALGGEMGKAIDATSIQIRILNTGKGPAVQALRAQADKRLYSLYMKRVVESQPNLDVKQATISDVLVLEPDGQNELPGFQVVTRNGATYDGHTVILTTGTFLAGRLIAGEQITPGGRAGESAAIGLSDGLRRMGLRLQRLKTGTPPRVHARTIDFSQTELHPGSDVPLYFSHRYPGVDDNIPPDPAPRWINPIYPNPHPTAWRPQLPCYLVHTTQETHEIIRANLHRAPMFTGVIEGVGPRYCPSIEDKIVRFAHKESHGLFLEPEGWETSEVYVQGANTSLPEDVQLAMLHSIPALRNAEIMRVGYAVEYDAVPPSSVTAALESKAIPGLFMAGQINGTSGYEEAGAQGLIAGINAARRAHGMDPFILRRDQAYIGVLIDDLVTKEHTEPYRLMTSRSEYRLLLRQDNADMRLTKLGYELGLISRARYEAVENKRQTVADEVERLGKTWLNPTKELNARLIEAGIPPIQNPATLLDIMRRTEVDAPKLYALWPRPESAEQLQKDVAEQIEIEAKYAGYIAKQAHEVERLHSLETRRIPENIDYDAIPSLRTEARIKLQQIRPLTLGQAGRISGVNPPDVSILMVYLQSQERRSESKPATQEANAQ